ncbi:MAG: hypothetical protein ACPG19_09795, partial [Saprospiraceae bacterium]
MKYFLLLLCSMMVLASCDNTEEGVINIKEYYFPIDNLIDGGDIYEFRAIVNNKTIAGQNDTLLPEYFKYEYFPNDTAKMLITTQFDQFCRQTAIYRDEVVSNGVLQVGMRLMSYDSLKSAVPKIVDATVEKPNVFLFEVKDSSQFVYQSSWKNPLDETDEYTIARKRKYIGKTTHLYNGKTYDAVEFEIIDRITARSPTQGDFHNDFSKIERYAKGLGLVYFTIPNGESSIRYELSDVFKMERFIEKCNTMFFNDY